VALRVDRALELRGGDVAAIGDAGGPGGDGDGAVEVARLGDGLVPILDLSRFLARAEAANEAGEGRA
jgi:hypothetical protein